MNQPRAYLDRQAANWVRLFESEDPIDRRLGAYAVGELGAAAADMASPLVAMLEDPVTFVRVWAAAALARVSPERDEAIAALIKGTEDEIAFVRSLAAWHIGRLGSTLPLIESALPALQRLLEDDDASVRHEAALALERLRPDADVTGTWGSR